MQSLVIIIVAFWFAFVTTMQSLHGWERFIVTNDYSPLAFLFSFGALFPIAFGYAVFFQSIVSRSIAIAKIFTITLMCGVMTALLFFFLSLLRSTGDPIFIDTYITLDRYLRDHHGIVLTWMDYGNSLLFLGAQLWWLSTGIALLFTDRKNQSNRSE